jgi:HPt (histidine-containing phosphotransfer) domain-containing protein
MTEFEDRMLALRARFIERAGGEREQLILAVSSSNLPEIRRIGHSLSGAGGVFGYSTLSAEAQQVEEAMDAPAASINLEELCRPLFEELDRVLQDR